MTAHQDDICSICLNHRGTQKIFAREMVKGTREEFPYILCSSCQSLSIEHIPEKIEEMYDSYPSLENAVIPKQSFKNFIKNKIKKYTLLHRSRLSKLLLSLLNSYDDLRVKALFSCDLKKTSRILDVGAGSGDFIYEMFCLGFKNIVGIDPSLKKSKIFYNGAKVLKKTIFEINEIYDIITFHHSFEHMPHPSLVLEKISCLLTNGGVCVIRLPNIDSWSFRKFGENWSGIHAPYHLFLPSTKGMKLLAERAGLRIQEVRWEQLTESFLRSVGHSLNFADFEKNGIRNLLQDLPLGSRIPAFFTKTEIKYWKQKRRSVIKSEITDYISYYLQKP